jgi:hypothetical protein
MSKIANLQQALSRSTGKTAPAVTEPPAAAPTANADPAPLPGPRQPSRAGQVNISAWLNADFKSGLRLVQARKGGSAALQDLMAEALNDLFTKYNVPTVRQE